MTWLLGITVRVVGALPLVARQILGRALGYAAALIPSRDRHIARLQLKSFLPEAANGRTIARMYANLGQSALESLNLRPMLARAEDFVHCGNWDYLDALRRRGQPVVALTGHMGNWDLLGAYFVQKGVPLATIGREARKRGMQPLLERLRAAYGIETIWRSDMGGLKRIVEILKERKVISALIDQDTRVSNVYVPFFGAKAATPSALVGIAARYQAVFVSVFIVRTGFRTYEIFAKEFAPGLSVEELLTQFNARLEGYIRSYPDQWVWFHKRWRTLDNGTRFSSREYIEHLERESARAAGGRASP